MQKSSSATPRFQGIAFVGNYLPRICGIATFTYDLAEAVARKTGERQPVIVAAINDTPDGYAYPNRVKFEIRQDNQIDYSRAADFLNFSHVDLVCLQHEYGIFGGEWGSNILTLIRELNRPLVVTCHTVVKNTNPTQEEIFSEIAARATKLVVMSNSAFSFLEDIYGIDRDKIVYIPHGIHDVPFIDPNYYKDHFGVEGQRVLLTFGLLHGDKGIEYVIEALPTVIARHPRTTYVILGATHPTVVANEGEAYRLSLQRKVRNLELENHVLFHPRFVELEELLEYLGAADICVTPYLNVEQITSGALCYAMGTGKAVVSTPFWHAEELLADGRGVIVPMRSPEGLADAILHLLDDEVTLSAMRKKAYVYTRSMIWPTVALDYLNVFNEVRSHVPKTFPMGSATRRPIAATNVPAPKLEHLVRLSDDTGIAHHARNMIPDWSYGYYLEDAATALVISAKYWDIFADKQAARLVEVYLGLLHVLLGDGRDAAESLDYSRHRRGRASEGAFGKSVWALGYMVSHGPPLLSAVANDLFLALLDNADLPGLRGKGYAILGSANYLRRFPGASQVKRFISKQATQLAAGCAESGWAARWDYPDWAVAAQAMIVAGSTLGDAKLRQRGAEMIEELREVTCNGTVFFKAGDNPDEEELPVTAATFIEALSAAFYVKRSEDLLIQIRAAADWFLGANRLHAALYNFSSGGCHDAITATGLNRNQGTEATCYCLLAFLTLHRLAGIETSSQGKTSLNPPKTIHQEIQPDS